MNAYWTGYKMLTSETAEEQNEGKLRTVSMCMLTLFPQSLFCKKNYVDYLKKK